MRFPTAVPNTVEPLLRNLVQELGSLVPEVDAVRICRAWGELPLMDVGSVGLEIALPPSEASCDASVLLSAKGMPPGLDDADEILGRLARDAGEWHPGTVWWELDASRTPSSAGVFWRTGEDQPSFGRLQQAVSDQPGLVRALATLEPWYRRWNTGAPGLVGVFPSRTPPAAGMLLPIWPEYIDAALARLSDVGVCVSPHDPRVQMLRTSCTSFSLALGADALGRMSVSFEAAFIDRENAMLRGDWGGVFADSTAWGCSAMALDALLDTQGHQRYDTFPPLVILTGIDHVKVGPGGRTKAYVGALPLSASGVRGARDVTRTRDATGKV